MNFLRRRLARSPAHGNGSPRSTSRVISGPLPVAPCESFPAAVGIHFESCAESVRNFPRLVVAFMENPAFSGSTNLRRRNAARSNARKRRLHGFEIQITTIELDLQRVSKIANMHVACARGKSCRPRQPVRIEIAGIDVDLSGHAGRGEVRPCLLKRTAFARFLS